MELACFLIGMSAGGAAMMFYFHRAGLIRTREEYYRAFPKEAPKGYWEGRDDYE